MLRCASPCTATSCPAAATSAASPGARRTISPSMKNVACHPRSSSTARNCGVDAGSGPSSNVSATCVGVPTPARRGARSRRIGPMLASAGVAWYATTVATPIPAPAPSQRAEARLTRALRSPQLREWCRAQPVALELGAEVHEQAVHARGIGAPTVDQVHLRRLELRRHASGPDHGVGQHQALAATVRPHLIERVEPATGREVDHPHPAVLVDDVAGLGHVGLGPLPPEALAPAPAAVADVDALG